MFAGLPTTGLRIMASDVGAVGEFVLFNRQRFPAKMFASACSAALDYRATAVRHPSYDHELFYEVLRVKHGIPLFGSEHIARLETSLRLCESTKRFHAESEKIPVLPVERSPWCCDPLLFERAKIADSYCCGTQGVEELMRDVSRSLLEIATAHEDLEQNVKIFVFMVPRDHTQPSIGELDDAPPSTSMIRSAATGGVKLCFSYCLYFVNAHYPPPELYAEGVTLRLLRDAQRELPNAKIVQATLRERAVEEQKRTGCFEVLLCHKDGLVPEGSRSNFLLIAANGHVEMSCDEDVLLGITRKAVEECCAAAGIPVTKRKLYVDDVMNATAIAMTGTSVGVLPVARVNDREFHSASHPLLRKIRELYEDRARVTLPQN